MDLYYYYYCYCVYEKKLRHINLSRIGYGSFGVPSCFTVYIGCMCIVYRTQLALGPTNQAGKLNEPEFSEAWRKLKTAFSPNL